jgi:C4-type Zn-finger protein
MFSPSKSSASLGFPLVAMFVCYVPVLGEEIKYLPDHPRLIISMDPSASAKSKTYQELLKIMKTPKGPEEVMGLPVGKIARITFAANDFGSLMDDEFKLITTVKPITAAEVKAAHKPGPNQKNFAYKEIKHGPFTIYQETFQTQLPDKKPGPVVEGRAFFIAEAKYVVRTRNAEMLKKIIDRDKAAALSPVMQAGLKEAGLNNAVSAVVDIPGLPAFDRDILFSDFVRQVTDADLKANARVQTLVLKVSESGKAKLSVTLICKDAAGAGAVKSVVERTMKKTKEELKELKEDPKIPADVMKLLTSVRATWNAIELSTSGNRVLVSVETQPAVLADVFHWYFLSLIGRQAS